MARKSIRATSDWLRDIVDWGDQISVYLDGMDEKEFLLDRKTQDAVVRCLECVGEASRNIITSGEAAKFPDADLVEAYWTRNRLAHGYYNLNLSRVWETATVSVPKLVAAVRQALATGDG